MTLRALPRRLSKSRVSQVLVGLVVFVAAVSIGLAMYFNERSTRAAVYELGDTTASDRIDIEATMQNVDGAAGRVTVHVLVTVEGRFAQNGDNRIPAEPLVVESTALSQAPLRIAAGDRTAPAALVLSLTEGVVHDYPFDSYRTSVGFDVTASGVAVPLSVTLRNLDGMFLPKATDGDTPQTGTSYVDLRIPRSRGTLIFAWFMMFSMWALALVVLGAAWILISQRRGLVWPALGWMAAALFAMVSFRNAAPGAPPSGSLLDYAAFWWAEAIIALSLVAVTATGLRVERRPAEPAEPEPKPEPATAGAG